MSISSRAIGSISCRLAITTDCISRTYMKLDEMTTQPSVLQQPIINSPFEAPRYHWLIQRGERPEKLPGRRKASFYLRVPERAARGRQHARQRELIEETAPGEEYDLALVNLLRERLTVWRVGGYEGVTSVTRELLNLWQREDRGQRLFFAQMEAAETVIFLVEGPAELLRGIKAPPDEPGAKAKENGAKAFLRYALKMATGSGKTTVMGMLAAWSVLNAVASPKDKRFSDTVLVICPNVTIRDRLQELNPNLGNASLYRTRELVPPHRMEELRRGEVIITNWHGLEKKEVAEVNGVSAKVVKRGDEQVATKTKTIEGEKTEVIETRYLESDQAWLKRILRTRRGRSRSILVFNDESHHAYRRGDAADKDEVVLDREFASMNAREATVWIEGLDRIHKLLAGKSGKGIHLCVDLSATPFYIQGSGNEVGKPFPWLVSDFTLLEAIESGLVKIPQLPTRDITGASVPPYFNIWRWVEEKAEEDGHRGALTPEIVVKYATAPIISLAADYAEVFEAWERHYKEGLRRYPVPPVFIVVCRDTRLAKAVYEWLADEKGEVGSGPALFRNRSGQDPVTIRIDSKVSEDIEAGRAIDEVTRLRYALDTVGKTQWPAGKPPEDYVEIVRKHNEKAADDDNLQWIDVNKPPGRDLRCIISVAMLTEGWDANTVTHVVGLRPFGSQLLCEQVVGRALRRTSYDTDEQTGFFVEQTAQIFGVPFELIPFKVDGTVVQPPKPPPSHIYAVEEKVAYEIQFPIVTGYQDPGIVDVRVDWERVSPLTVDPKRIPDSVELKGLTTADGRLAVYGPGSTKTLTLRDWRETVRLQQVAFMLAGDLCQRWVKNHGKTIPPHVLFPRLLVAATRFMDEKVVCIGSTQRVDVLIGTYYRAAMNSLYDALAAEDFGGERELPAILKGGAGMRSTQSVDFQTSREIRSIEKCHLNALVADTKTWEQCGAYVLDKYAGVSAWVKNDHLGFEIPYHKDHSPQRYLPDFIAVLDNGLHLIVEIKGQRSADSNIKEAAARRWVDAVNRDGNFGQWKYTIVYDPPELAKALDSLCVTR